MVATNLDLNGDNAVEIGADYEISIQLCNADDLLEYVGICNVKQSVDSDLILLSPTITIVNKDTFTLSIDFGGYPDTLNSGNYLYDVLFYKPEKRFYAVYGKIQFIRRISELII